MSRRAYYVLRTFHSDDDGLRRGHLEHAGGTHACYWHARPEDIPPPGQYQMLMHDTHISLRGHPAEIHPVGTGRGIEIGHCIVADRAAHHGAEMLAYLAGMHRTRDAQGVGTWLEVR